MGRRSALVMVGALVFGLAACGGGGGGGDEDAFCDSLDALSGLVEDGDLGDNDGLGDAVDIANDLREAASDDQEDAVQEVGQTLAEADPDDAADTAETVQDELGDFADDCDIDEFAEAPEETTTTTEVEETTTTEEPEETTTTSEGQQFSGNETVEAREPIPGDLEPDFAALADTCFRGDFTSCDTLFNTTPVGSVAEAYGDTCAGRIADGRGFDFECATLVAEPFAPPAEIVDVATANACFGGDMVACDTLSEAPDDTIDRAYGFFCGGRLNADVVADASFCQDIFGPVSEFN